VVVVKCPGGCIDKKG